MSNERDLGLIRRLDAVRGVAERTGDPDAWALYERLKAEADKRLGINPDQEPTPIRRSDRRVS